MRWPDEGPDRRPLTFGESLLTIVALVAACVVAGWQL